jgi:glycine/D-amino acid oxidase-like deaminating enzyme
MNREEMLSRVKSRAKPWDIVVIGGGGAVGAGVALDASSRGLVTLLIEREDFGKGTAMAIGPKVARLVAAELGRDEQWIAGQIERFTALAGQYTLAHAKSAVGGLV